MTDGGGPYRTCCLPGRCAPGGVLAVGDGDDWTAVGGEAASLSGWACAAARGGATMGARTCGDRDVGRRGLWHSRWLRGFVRRGSGGGGRRPVDERRPVRPRRDDRGRTLRRHQLQPLV